ncbi:MAG: NUDIX domain-containing protein [Deltaproteobacteria bacterium]|nr:MAG: NUDIX domain-containing protein [Deltaproteobacteria bacterium]
MPLLVTAAIILHEGRVLAARRPPESRHGGLWEFPGGKLEPGETPEAALRRELLEELDLPVEVERIFDVVHHRYEWGEVLILAYLCHPEHTRIRNLQVAEHRWLLPDELTALPFLPADRPLIDQLRFRSHKAMRLLDTIRGEETLDGLAAIRRRLFPVARSLLAETRSAAEAMTVLTHIHQAIIRRAFELCLAARIAGGAQPPELRYAFLILGSGGRGEMLLGPDQDHAFLYEDLPPERLAEAEAFFAPLAAELVAALERIGYPPCDGRVMADNPHWRGRLADWRERIRGWVAGGEPQQIRDSSIFFDLAPLAGDETLAAELRAIICDEVSDQPAFLYQMMALDVRGRVPLGLFGGFSPERGGEHAGKLSLKLGGLIYLIDCIRIFALDKGIHATGTLDRLQALVEHHVFTAETADNIRAAFEALAFLRLRQEIAQLEAGLPPGHHIDPNTLSKTDQELLREAFQAVSKLQEATKRYFSRTPF